MHFVKSLHPRLCVGDVGLSDGPVSSTNKWIWVIRDVLKPIYVAVCVCFKYIRPSGYSGDTENSFNVIALHSIDLN